MQLSEIRAEILRMLGGITTTEYSAANMNTSVNKYHDEFINRAIRAAGEWQVQGEVATTDIVADQQEYTFPADLIYLHRVEANFTNGTNTWDKLNVIDMRTEQRALSNTATSVAVPTSEIRIYDESIFLMDKPSTGVTDGLKIYFSQEATDLSADADIPNLPDFTHHGLVYGAMVDYAVSKRLYNDLEGYKTLFDEMVRQLEDYYANRLPAKRTRITPRAELYS